MFYLLHFLLNLQQGFIRLCPIETGNPNHRYLGQFVEVLVYNFSNELFFERFKAVI